MEVTDVQYKESEIGVIPVDWEVKTLGDVGEVKIVANTLPRRPILQRVNKFIRLELLYNSINTNEKITRSIRNTNSKSFT
ncbi:MAG: hypothetical protein IPI37_05460 [Bacteroidales bacterium]|nr:hypothetical protein [Bacteroidales bacterium]